jgi:NADH-quinone oxidoreductase subunit K
VRTPIAYFLFLGALLFSMGTIGVLVNRNALRIFMSVELQLNAVNLTLVAFARMHNDLTGQVLAFFSMVSIYRRRRSVDVDEVREMRW